MHGNSLRFETLLCDLSTSLINLSSNKVDQVIEQWLTRTSKFLGADRSGFYQISKDGMTLTLTHSYVAPGMAPVEKMTASEIFPWSTRQIRKDRVILFRRIPDDIPSKAQNERQFFVMAGSKSFVAVPLKVGGVVLGGFRADRAGVSPFILLMIMGLLLISLVPELSLYLVR